MKKKLTLFWKLLLVGCYFLPVTSIAQLKTYKFEQIDSLQNIQKRKVVVYIHTNWCKYCIAMENTTFKNKGIISMLNNSFYFIDLNAEEKRTIFYQCKTFEFKPNGNQIGIHELAKELGTTEGLISYPTLCFLNEKNEIVLQKNGFTYHKELFDVLEQIK